MPLPTAMQATIDAALSALHDGATDPGADPVGMISRAPERTIEPSRLPEESAKRALALLRDIAPAGNLARQLRMGELLGRGGMGEVHLAEQISMGRRVAVKTLRAEMATEANTTKLLHEAWVTGYLEHPNVIPVYDIAIDDDDRPIILLKRIEGVQWGELMDDPRVVLRRFNANDLLEWNLRVLMQVCDAIHFAHNRGIVHRDIKPENIMIGEFGEVYVVDWGIAVSTRESHAGRIPLARHAKQMAGTPCYMAPEMLGGENSLVTERTDVYLLGAMLFEVVTGHVPHQGEHLREILASVITGPPQIPDGVPHELGRICRRAMDPDPNARFENPLQVKLAIEGFLGHRGSRQLARHAAGRLRELLEELERPDADDTDEERHTRLYGLLAECRFGFRESLNAWSDNVAATEGERRATSAMVEYELRAGDPKAAATLISGLDPQPPDLRRRVADALRAKTAEQDELRQRAGDIDSTAGLRTRTFLALVFGLTWTLSPLVGRYGFGEEYRESYLGMVYVPALFLLVSLGFAWWARESIMRARVNRRMAVIVAFALIAQMVLGMVAGIMQVPIVASITLAFFLWMTVTALTAITVDSRIWPAALGYGVALFAAAFWPEQRYWFMSASHAVLTSVLMLMWGPKALELVRRGEDPPPYPDLERLKRLSSELSLDAIRPAERLLQRPSSAPRPNLPEQDGATSSHADTLEL